jgi:hypothetical protein
LGARAQPREAAEAEPGAEPEAAAEAEPDAEPEAVVGAAELDAAPQPGEVAAVVRDAVLRLAAAGRVAPELRPAAGPSAAAPSAFHRGQALPWLAL